VLPVGDRRGEGVPYPGQPLVVERIGHTLIGSVTWRNLGGPDG
jgi:hypothetical protein